MPESIMPAPASTPSKHGLLQSATRSPRDGLGDDKWELGFQFTRETCAEPESWLIPCVGAGADPGPGATITENRGPTIDDAAPDELMNWVPYVIRASFTCTTQQFRSVDFGLRAQRIFELGKSKLMESELWRGDAAGYQREVSNPAFNDPNLSLAQAGVTDITGGLASVAPSIAIRSLIQHAATAPGGPQCCIHATPATVMAWMQGNALAVGRDSRLYTRVGEHMVIAGTGYTGQGPGLTAIDKQIHWAYITTPVYLIESAEPQVLWQQNRPGDYTNRTHNDSTAIVQQTAAVYWDGCVHAGIPVDVEGSSL